MSKIEEKQIIKNAKISKFIELLDNESKIQMFEFEINKPVLVKDIVKSDNSDFCYDCNILQKGKREFKNVRISAQSQLNTRLRNIFEMFGKNVTLIITYRGKKDSNQSDKQYGNYFVKPCEINDIVIPENIKSNSDIKKYLDEYNSHLSDTFEEISKINNEKVSDLSIEDNIKDIKKKSKKE